MNALFRLRVIDESHVIPVYITKSYDFKPMSHLYCGYSYRLEDSAVVDYGTAMCICHWCWSRNIAIVVPEYVEQREDD